MLVVYFRSRFRAMPFSHSWRLKYAHYATIPGHAIMMDVYIIGRTKKKPPAAARHDEKRHKTLPRRPRIYTAYLSYRGRASNASR